MSQKTIIIPIKSFREAIPKEGVWYSYGDEIYHSVICAAGRISHIRSQSGRKKRTGDNIMSDWHRDWQYNQIEHFYGLFVSDARTYEVAIIHEGERHIIDSVVNKIAIEFQHTLSVAVNELDKRFTAQKAHGYIPYLVLDFSEYELPTKLRFMKNFDINKLQNLIIDCKYSGEDSYIFRMMFKWASSLHFKEGNVFFEFEDFIIRFHRDLLCGLTFSKEVFINDLLDLENQLEQRVQTDRETKRRLQEKALERALEFEKREIEERFELERRKLKEAEEARIFALNNNKIEKREHEEYRRFRDMLKIPIVNQYLKKYSFDSMLFVVEIKSHSKDKSYVKDYVYLCDEEDVMLHYRTKGEREVLTKRYKYLSSEIKIHRRVNYEVRTFSFLQEEESSWRKVEARTELAIGFLHSFKHPSMVKYDKSGREVSREWYLFNKKVDQDIFKLAGECYEYYGVLEDNENLLTKDQYNRLEKFSNMIDEQEDPYRFIEYTNSYHGITAQNFKEYYNDKWIEFDTKLQKKFFIKSL